MGLEWHKEIDRTQFHQLENDLDYLKTIIQTRLLLHFNQLAAYKSVSKIPPPSLEVRGDPIARLCKELQLGKEEFIVLLMALVPYVKPHFFDQVIQEIIPQAGAFPQLGGIRGKYARGFLPTGETVLFLLAGENLQKRFEILHILSEEHLFAKQRILYVDHPPQGEPPLNGRLVLAQDYVDLICLGKPSRPKFSMEFPAQLVETEMEWDDLVINAFTQKQIRELENWINYGEQLMYEWGMKKKLKMGYRVLFHGPPGTGKTLAATLLGKYTGKEVYRVDLSMVVSKFIGETEKNLSNLFSRAENKGWILFFDEADALFGKRTQVRDAHDKYANQEVAYLLQRVEGYDGLVILASNFMSNIDEAFVRRFQAIIHFPMPNADERLILWKNAFPNQVRLDNSIDLRQIARDYELSGASIMNVVQYCCLEYLAAGKSFLNKSELVEGIRREFRKGGKVV